MHRYRQPGTEEGAPVREQLNQTLGVGLEEEGEANKPSEVYEKFNAMLHAGVTITVGRGTNRRVEVLSIPFIKKYIQYAKSRIKPILTKGAADHIISAYSALRNDEMEGNQRKTSPMTARTLETLIRLASAHAKSRLSNRVEEKDAQVAEGVLRFALFKEVVEDESRRRKKARRSPNEDAMSTDDESDSDDGDAGDGALRASTTRRSTRTPGRDTRGSRQNGSSAAGAGAEAEEEEEDLYGSTPARTSRTQRTNGNAASSSQFSMASSKPASQLLQDDSQDPNGEEEEEEEEEEEAAAQPAITAQRVQVFQVALGQLIDGPLFANDAADVEPLVAAVNARLRSGEARFADAEALQALEELNERNKIMLSGSIVYKL
jgi:DNA replication licensing factor MCM3